MYPQILVAIDGSPTSAGALSEAIGMARLCGARLRLLHVIDDLSLALALDPSAGFSVDAVARLRSEGARVLAQARERVAAAGVAVDTVLHDRFEGSVPDLVLAEAGSWPAQLIVLGTHGRRGVQRLVMGSSAERILRLARVPVLLVRSAPATATAAAPAPAGLQGAGA